MTRLRPAHVAFFGLHPDPLEINQSRAAGSVWYHFGSGCYGCVTFLLRLKHLILMRNPVRVTM